MTIPNVAYDELIEVSWGNAVTNSLNNMTQMYVQIIWNTIGSEILAPTSYATSGALPDVWFTVGGTGYEITVPDWATHAIAQCAINGAYLNAQGNCTYDLQLQVGTNAGRRIRRTGIQSRDRTNPDNRDWFGVSWIDRLPVSSIDGDRHVRVRAGRYVGSQRVAVDASSDASVFLVFEGAIE